MDEPVLPPSPTPSNPDRLSDSDLENMGVHRDARSFVESTQAFGSGVSALYGWAKRKGGSILFGFVAWNRKAPINLAFSAMSVAFVVVCLIAYNGHGTTTPNPQPPQPATATQTPANTGGMRQHKVKAGEHLASIGKLYGINRLDMEKANPDIDVNKLAIGQIVNVPVPTVASNEN